MYNANQIVIKQTMYYKEKYTDKTLNAFKAGMTQNNRGIH